MFQFPRSLQPPFPQHLTCSKLKAQGFQVGGFFFGKHTHSKYTQIWIAYQFLVVYQSGYQKAGVQNSHKLSTLIFNLISYYWESQRTAWDVKIPVNSGIFTISTGDRRISSKKNSWKLVHSDVFSPGSLWGATGTCQCIDFFGWFEHVPWNFNLDKTEGDYKDRCPLERDRLCFFSLGLGNDGHMEYVQLAAMHQDDRQSENTGVKWQMLVER